VVTGGGQQSRQLIGGINVPTYRKEGPYLFVFMERRAFSDADKLSASVLRLADKF
jgi:hypothetical protein